MLGSSVLDLLLRLEAEAESASEELESGQEQEAVIEQHPHSATSSPNLPPQCGWGEELNFGCAVGFREAAAV